MEGQSFDSQNETEKMRFELEEYLREFKEKKDENGIPLVHFPSNFDSIVDAMNRKDLNSNEHNCWSKYLFQSKFDDEIEKTSFEEGRYKNMVTEFTQENEYRKGMAEIQLLDKQLGKLNKKAQTIKLETAQLELTEGDSTFVTRLITPGGRGGGRSTANSSRASSPQSTTRSTRSSSSRTNSKESVRGKMRDEDHWKENETTETPGRSDFKDIGVEGEEGGEGEEREEDEEGEEEEEERREKDISRELRLKLLLDDDESETNPVWQDLLRYGHSKESEERINEIDAKLAEFEQERARYLFPTSESEQQQHEEPHSETSQRLPQIVSGKGASTSVASASVAVAVSRPEKVIGDSYLKEQKMATIRRKYSQQLDLLLSLVHSQKLDLSGLVNPLPPPPVPVPSAAATGALPPPPSSPSASGTSSTFLPKIRNIHHISQSNQHLSSFSASSTALAPASSDLPAASVSSPALSASLSVHQITPVSAINPNRVVTMTDIQRVVQELCYQDATSVPSSSSASVSNSRASKSELDRLMFSLRDETNELSALRSLAKQQQQQDKEEQHQRRGEGGSYSERLQEYHRRVRFHEQQQEEREEEVDEEEEREQQREKERKPIDLEEKSKGKGMLSRMSTLELKNGSKDKDGHNYGNGSSNLRTSNSGTGSGGQGKPLKLKTKGAKQQQPQQQQSSSGLSRTSSAFASASVSATGSLALDLESLQQRMNSMLTRATQMAAAGQGEGGEGQEDESDVKMRQLLEDIYSSALPVSVSWEGQEEEQEGVEGDGGEEEQGLPFSLYDSSPLLLPPHEDKEEEQGARQEWGEEKGEKGTGAEESSLRGIF